MKYSLLLLSLTTGLLFNSVALADQTVSFPEDHPIIDLSFPDDWEIKPKEGVIYAHPKDDAGLFFSLTHLESTDPTEAAAQAKEDIEALFKNVKYKEPETAEAGEVNIMLINAKGTDEDGPANINLCLIGRKDKEALLALKCISSQEAFEKHGDLGTKIINSITAHKATPEAQTFSYPSAEKPDYAIDFPADWVMKANDEGVYVESPDKLVAANVIMVPKAELATAEEALKKSVGERFKEILWNEGNDPEVNKDDALGVTATFHNAVASDGDGTEKYSVNLVSYDREAGDKSLVLLVQNPQHAIEKHAENLEAILKSIKVR